MVRPDTEQSTRRLMEKVVVTGGAGFIGSHLADELAARDYRVVIFDDLSTGSTANVEAISPKVEFERGSITDLPALQRVCEGARFIFHLAALPSVPRSIENPLASQEVNGTGTLKVLLAARDAGVSKVVYSSSSSVYGDTPTLPKREDMTPHPQSPYAVTKAAGEHYCRVFEEVYGLPTACLRYFNVYGPRQDPNSQYAAVIPSFIQRTGAGEPPVIFGDGEQTRDFTFVRDVVAANIQAAEGQASGVYNIGRGERVSLNELARLVIELSGRDLKPVYEGPRAGDVRHSLADISRARGFGYDPQFSLKEGLRYIYDSLKK
jgi:UDP-glucose 4-epimerase